MQLKLSAEFNGTHARKKFQVSNRDIFKQFFTSCRKAFRLFTAECHHWVIEKHIFFVIESYGKKKTNKLFDIQCS